MSDRISRLGEGVIAYSVAPSTDDVTIAAPTLSDLSPGDKPWDKHRSFADRVQGHYAGSKFQDYANRVPATSVTPSRRTPSMLAISAWVIVNLFDDSRSRLINNQRHIC